MHCVNCKRHVGVGCGKREIYTQKTKLHIAYFVKKEMFFGQGLYCRSLDL